MVCGTILTYKWHDFDAIEGAMYRINIYLTNRQEKELKTIKDETELTLSELLRRALDLYIQTYKLDKIVVRDEPLGRKRII